MTFGTSSKLNSKGSMGFSVVKGNMNTCSINPNVSFSI